MGNTSRGRTPPTVPMVPVAFPKSGLGNMGVVGGVPTMPASLWYLTVVATPTTLLNRSPSVTVHLKGASTRDLTQSVSKNAGTLRGEHSMDTLRPLTLAPTICEDTSTRLVWPPAVAVVVTMAAPC